MKRRPTARIPQLLLLSAVLRFRHKHAGRGDCAIRLRLGLSLNRVQRLGHGRIFCQSLGLQLPLTVRKERGSRLGEVLIAIGARELRDLQHCVHAFVAHFARRGRKLRIVKKQVRKSK
jgi:hypothetical protein